MVESIILCFGYLSFLVIIAKIGFFLTSLIYRKFICSSLDVTKCGGKWALVTGSTDGIGKAYAFALAQKGLNIVLVSRSMHKLENVASELVEKYPKVETKVIEVDFSREDSSSYIPKIEESIKDIDIGILVNNVGLSYEHPQEFLELDSTYVEAMVNVNIVSINAMTRIVLPQMVERKNGVIINISSFLAAFPTPLLTVYSACKSYKDLFSQGLAKEYLSKGITVQCVMPGYVVSKLSKIRKPSLTVPTPTAFVRSALSRLGIESRTCGYWAHDAMIFIGEIMPKTYLLDSVYNNMKTIRAIAMRKKQKSDRSTNGKILTKLKISLPV